MSGAANLKPVVTKDRERTLIVGMGPAGLVSAYYQMLLGHKVTLIDKRLNPFERDRTITLHSSLLELMMTDFSNLEALGYHIKYHDMYHKGDFGVDIVKNGKSLKDLDHLDGLSPIDLKFFKLIIKQQRTVAINEIQEYFLSKIQEKAFQLSIATDPKDKILEVITGESVIDIDTDKQKSAAILQAIDGTKTTFEFDNIIVAEGSKRSVTKMLFEKIRGKMVAIGRLPKTHSGQELSAVVEIAVPDDLFAGIDPATKFKILRRLVAPNMRYSQMRLKHLPRLKELGWNESRLPEFFVQYNKQKNIFYLAGEFPNDWKTALLHSPQDPEIVKKVAELVVEVLNIEYPEFNAKFNENLIGAINAFLVNPDYIKDNYLDFPNGSRAFIIGDSAIGSNFNFGNGFEKAARMAKAVARCFIPTGTNKGKFNSFMPLINEHKKLVAQFYTKKHQQWVAVKTREYPVLGGALMRALSLNDERTNALHWIYRSAKARAKEIEVMLPIHKPTKPRKLR